AGDWDRIFEGYDATVDYPGCVVYKELMEKYPDAKVILTVRDPHSWWKSANETIMHPGMRGSLVTTFFPFLAKMRRMTAIMFQHAHGVPLLTSEQQAVAAFNDHAAAVRAHVLADRLLVYRVGPDGWGPLCAFLGVPEPRGADGAVLPFPRVNERDSFVAMRVRMERTAMALAVASGAAVVAAVAVAARFALRSLLRRG
ncbi:hypothetical protein HK405_000992, partial [Cladochytrium tenue]